MTPYPLLIPPSILDTDIFSELGRGRNTGVVMRAILYSTMHRHLTISATTLMEAISGWQRHNRHDRIEVMLERTARWEVLAIDKSIATLAGRIDGDLQRMGQTIGVADCLIAATALHHGLVLVTGNTAHYQRMRTLGYNLELDNWRSP